MTYSEMLELVRAGFMKDEIMAMEKNQPKVEPEQPKVEPEQPKVEPEQPKVEPEQPKADPNKAVLDAITKLTNAIQASNIMNVNNKTNAEKSVDEIIMQMAAK